MAEFTKKLNLEKPSSPEFYSIDIFNANADKIDAAFVDAEAENSNLSDIIYVSSINYGTTAPATAENGRLFFLLDKKEV